MKTLLIRSISIIIALSTTLACGIGSIANPPNSSPTTVQSKSGQGKSVSYQNVSLVIPEGLATNALVGTVPALTDAQKWSPWDIAPQHIRILLDNYSPCCTFHPAEIRVYPAQAYADISPTSANEDISRLKSILHDGAPLTKENMPLIPFFNAGQVIAAQMNTLSFKDGSGVRLITQYDNGITPINNSGLFYHFQGLTSDQKYLVIVILPITADFLPPDTTQYTIDNPTVMDFPGYYKPNATGDDFTAYFQAVTDKLNATPAEGFTPSLSTLDALVQSINITP